MKFIDYANWLILINFFAWIYIGYYLTVDTLYGKIAFVLFGTNFVYLLINQKVQKKK